MMRLLIVVLTIYSFEANARDLGTYGVTFPVTERNVITMIKEKINAYEKAGKMQEINEQFKERVEKHVVRPSSVLTRVRERTKVYFFDPSVVVNSQEILGGGENISKVINPLKKIPSYQPCWFFLNGDDERQINLIMKEKKACSNPKYILTNGDVREAEKKFDSPVYFDQFGKITSKLHIKYVPTIVSRYKDRLKIVEYGEGKYESL